MNPREIIDTYGQLKAQKATLENTLQDIRLMVMPMRDEVSHRSGVPGTNNDGRSRLVSTAVQANMILGASMAGSLTPAAFQWFDLQLREDDLMDIKSVRDWFQDCSTRQKKAYDVSNFGVKIHEAYLDLGGFGTTAVLQEELPRDSNGRFQGVTFDTFPIGEYCFSEGGDGKPASFYRSFKLTAEQAFEKFSVLPRFAGLGDKIEAARNSTDPAKKLQRFEIVHAIFPRKNYKAGVDISLQMPVESVYVAREDAHVISAGGFEEFPLAIARWSQISEDRGWGRGPGWVALSEIRTQNRIRELGLKALAKDIAPPLLVPHKGVVGGIRTSPNAINYYNAAKYNGAKPEYLTSGSRWDIAQFNIEAIEREIRSIFYADQLQLKESPSMTATEVQVRYELMQRLLGPTFWRLVSELFNPILYRTFNIMLRGGAFKPMPPELKQWAQASGQLPTLDVVYTGPLARAQRADEVVAIQRAYELAGMIAAQKGSAEIFDNFDDDAAISEMSKQLGVPGKIMRGKEDRGAMREQRAQAQAEVEELQKSQMAATAMDKAASADQKVRSA